jgi:hypothetical protein
MISPVSFGSTYKVYIDSVSYKNSDINDGKISSLDCFLNEKKIKKYTASKNISVVSDSKKYEKKTDALYTIDVPNSLDNEFETYCANKGINIYKQVK